MEALGIIILALIIAGIFFGISEQTNTELDEWQDEDARVSR